MSILVQSSFDTAINEISEMIIPQNLIHINGYINNINIKIIIDTGATTSIIFKHSIDRLNINYLVDVEEQSYLNGIGNEISIGRLWYAELNLDKYLYPISLIVSRNKILDYDIILGINFLQTYKSLINFKTFSAFKHIYSSEFNVRPFNILISFVNISIS
jgi:hypothetical protein